jgi:hypothetical protein
MCIPRTERSSLPLPKGFDHPLLREGSATRL